MENTLEKPFASEKQTFRELITNQKSVAVFVRHPG
jgi:hypothetical protein